LSRGVARIGSCLLPFCFADPPSRHHLFLTLAGPLRLFVPAPVSGPLSAFNQAALDPSNAYREHIMESVRLLLSLNRYLLCAVVCFASVLAPEFGWFCAACAQLRASALQRCNSLLVADRFCEPFVCRLFALVVFSLIARLL
jgi:hypothetical protein